MKFKKIAAAGLAVCMLFSMAACGEKGADNQGKQEQPDQADQPGQSQEEGDSETGSKGGETITFATNVVGERANALEEVCKAFEEETGYTVDFQAPGANYEDLMKTKMSANELPDVFTTHGWSVARYSSYLMPVNDQPWAADISDQIKPIITDADGNMYVLPVDIDIVGTLYNVDILEEAGVNPEEIKTWDDFAAACEKVKAIGKTPLFAGGKDNWTVAQFFEWMAPSFYVTDETNSKAEELKSGTFDAEIWKEMAGVMDQWVKAGYFNADAVTADYSTGVNAFASGEIAFFFFGNYAVADAKAVNPDINVGMIPVPSNSTQDEPSLMVGEDIAIGVWKDTKVKEAAVELLNYMARPEVIKKLAESAGNVAGLNGVDAEIGDMKPYFDKYSTVEGYPYFDREYLPSGMWDVMAATGVDILSQKDGAAEDAATVMEQNFNDKK